MAVRAASRRNVAALDHPALAASAKRIVVTSRFPRVASMSDYVASLFSVEGKTALLTGAGGYLIGEMARALGRAGANVVCCDLRLPNAEKTAAEIMAAGGAAIGVQ